MGLFDDTGSKKNEVRIGVSDDPGNSRLKEDVEKKLDSGSSSRSSSSDVTIDDIHRQNEKIISLLEQLTDNRSGKKERSTGSGSSNRVTDRVTDRSGESSESSEGSDIGGGMDELL